MKYDLHFQKSVLYYRYGKLKRKEMIMGKYELETNCYGNVTGIPEEWFEVSLTGQKLNAFNIPYYKANIGRNKRSKRHDTEENKRRGYAIVYEKINEDEFNTSFYHIDKDGNPTEKFTEEDLKKFIEQQNEEYRKRKERNDKIWKRWKKDI